MKGVAVYSSFDIRLRLSKPSNMVFPKDRLLLLSVSIAQHYIVGVITINKKVQMVYTDRKAVDGQNC